MAAMEQVVKVENETKSTTWRYAQNGTRYTYILEILQEPDRARACGQGAKSSADRRPVDPPPIVELRILEGEGANQKDVTFSMHASYFLYATLEQARPIATGRVPAEQQRPCVLTGTPVAGMVYLEKPKAAGYFIFPDLSVRHEGRYRLSFSLFEDPKHPSLDDKPATNPAGPVDAMRGHVTHRHEVRSKPFNVFSAKKFPGLMESTSLSKEVADQGCRVRIRKDIRMRRRTGKLSEPDHDRYSDRDHYSDPRVPSATPDHVKPDPGYSILHDMSRPRSVSGFSQHSLGGPPSLSSRRPSLVDIPHPYHTSYSGDPGTPSRLGGPAAPSPTTSYAPMAYGAPHASLPPPPPPSSHYGPPPPSTHQYHGYHHSGAALPPPAPSHHGPPPLSAFDSPHHHNDTRRSSLYNPTLPPPPTQQQQPPHHYSSTAYHHPQPHAAAPLPPPPFAQHNHQNSWGSSNDYHNSRPTPTEPRVDTTSNSSSGSRTPLGTKLPSLITHFPQVRGPSPIAIAPGHPPPTYPPTADTFAPAGKRGYSSVFPDAFALSARLRDGARPPTSPRDSPGPRDGGSGSSRYGGGYGGTYGGGYDAPAAPIPAATDADPAAGKDELIQLNYRRSNGARTHRFLPERQQI